MKAYKIGLAGKQLMGLPSLLSKSRTVGRTGGFSSVLGTVGFVICCSYKYSKEKHHFKYSANRKYSQILHITHRQTRLININTKYVKKAALSKQCLFTVKEILDS